MEKEFEALMTFKYIITRCKDEDSYIIKFPLGVQKGTTFEEDMEKAYKVLEQALLKAQEMEKELADVEKIKTMMRQKDCVLRYIENEDCFAVKTILSEWYKLTPEFVESNVREEIKPLPVIEKIKQLKAENDEYKKVLSIIKEKDVDMYSLRRCETVEEYNAKFAVDEYQELTKEDFDLVKRWVENVAK